MIEKTRNKIWKLVNFLEWGDMSNNGHSINGISKELVNIPSFDEMFEKAVYDLKVSGLSVKQVTDMQHSNVVLRVCRQEDFTIKHHNAKYWLYGVDAFIKTVWGFYSECDVHINVSKQIVTLDFRPEFDSEYFRVTNFKDYFLKVR